MRTRTSNGISVLDHICRDCYTEDEKRRQKENKAKKAAAQITAPAPITPTPAAPPVTPTNAVTAQITSLTTNIGDFRTLTLTPAERERRRAEIYKAVDALLSTYNDPHEYAIPHLTPNYELMISAALRQIYVSEHIGANFQDMPVDVTYVGGTGYVRSVVAFSPEMAKHLAALQDGMMHYYRNR